MIDSNFLKAYFQLNSYNKKIVNRLTNDLVKLQLEEKQKNSR